MLQEEDSTEIGWFLWSTRGMDAGALADEISDVLGFNVGLKWRVINTASRGQLPENKKCNLLRLKLPLK